MNTADIRDLFLRFFEARKHAILPGSSLVPVGDPSVLLTSAGMQQFKPYFSGEKAPPYSRTTTVQKCFRATDIDEVGDSKQPRQRGHQQRGRRHPYGTTTRQFEHSPSIETCQQEKCGSDEHTCRPRIVSKSEINRFNSAVNFPLPKWKCKFNRFWNLESRP